MTPSPSVVVVPDQRGIEAFAGVAGVETVRWDLTGPPPARAGAAEVLVTRGVEPEAARRLPEQLPRLRMIQLFSAGRDAWAGLVPDGAVVSGVDGAHGGPVAEWVVAQLLAHYRDLAGYRARQRAQIWERRPTGTLAGKRVLVLGAGDIGENVVRRLEPFGAAATLAARTARAGVVDLATARAMLPEPPAGHPRRHRPGAAAARASAVGRAGRGDHAPQCGDHRRHRRPLLGGHRSTRQ